ncbi:transglycosylase SLT domain-containing protein [Nocardioides KLBMP 9356]|uniref:Transglycosylase SLT domain-containing protein n=1 Tax=Nocardioides potassii TaxID=2911371 RepID=A0ABS9HAM1_9ACTN|nr:transglycosylase SLT domain-containing protein [Nocardioides potassii]MCF6378236.1 transglycosylase SLT domain-containing protein [Nocardioides potassii]
MSITDVTARISQIQAQLAMLPASTSSSVTGAGGFSDVLSRTTSPTGATTRVTGEQVSLKALELVGLPYVWGGTDPQRGVDCSGLVQTVYGSFGIDLPRLSADQARAGTAVPSMDQARPGDLIAWDNSSRNDGADHIAIYLGDGRMIEAPRPGGYVQIVKVTTPPDYIRRVLPDPASATTYAPTSLPSARTTGGTVPAGTPYADVFRAAGAAHGVDPALLAAVARQESGFDPGAVSPAGARGLMQLMPGTARGLGVQDPFDPVQSVDGAARLLDDLIGRFGSVELALAAYNAGPGAVLRYDGVPPYPETQDYVASIMSDLHPTSQEPR